MAYDDLRAFIRALEKNGELKRIPFEVDPHLEITEFADRSVKQNGPALLFEKPRRSHIPVLINAFASMKRMEIALEVDSVEGKSQRAFPELIVMQKPEGFLGKLKDAVAEARGPGLSVSQDGIKRTVQRSGSQRQFLAQRYSCAELLAAGRWTIYYAANEWCSRAIRILANRIADAIACRCTTTAPLGMQLADAQTRRGTFPTQSS